MVFASFITKDIKMQSVVNLSLETETFSGPTFYLHIQNSPSGTISNVKNTLSEYTTYLQVQSFHISVTINAVVTQEVNPNMLYASILN